MPGRARRVGQKRDLNEHEWLCQPLVFGFVIPAQGGDPDCATGFPPCAGMTDNPDFKF